MTTAIEASELTQTGPGSVMGELMRQYWIPAALSSELISDGAPVRLRVERQLGYKSMKYLQRIVVTEQFEDGGDKGNIQNGWAWYVGI